MTRSDIVAAQVPNVRSTFIAILLVQAECGSWQGNTPTIMRDDRKELVKAVSLLFSSFRLLAIGA